MKHPFDPSIARAASAALYHCDLGSITPASISEDLGPYKSLTEMVMMTGKSIETWRRERIALAQAKAMRKRQRAAGTQALAPKVNIFAELLA